MHVELSRTKAKFSSLMSLSTTVPATTVCVNSTKEGKFDHVCSISEEAQKLHIYNTPPESPEFYENLKIDQEMRLNFIKTMVSTRKISSNPIYTNT